MSRHLLCIATPVLLGRMAVIPPVRSALHQYTPGFMDAPVGSAVCVVVFRVSNAAALAAWNAAVASGEGSAVALACPCAAVRGCRPFLCSCGHPYD